MVAHLIYSYLLAEVDKARRQGRSNYTVSVIKLNTITGASITPDLIENMGPKGFDVRYVSDFRDGDYIECTWS